MHIHNNKYVCDFCGRSYKIKENAFKHENRCSKNEMNKQINKDLEQVRQEATSLEHLIQMLEEVYMKYGIELRFHEYPSVYSDNVSNSHNSPRGYNSNWCGRATIEGIPTGYPGWSGRLLGTIKVIDSSHFRKNEITFSDLSGSWSDRISNLWFINTCSGGYGKNFSGHGIIWVYDFPKIHEQFKDDAKDFNVLTKDYTILLDKYNENYTNNLINYVDNDKQYKVCNNYLELLHKTTSELEKLKEKRQLFLVNEFNKKFGKPVPLPPTAFLEDTEKIMKVHSQVSHNSIIVEPNLEKMFDTINTLVNDINNYIDKNPEKFI